MISATEVEDQVKAFPAQRPCSLTDPETIRDNDWSAFRNAGTMINHWDRKAWENDRRAFYWFLSFDDSPALIELARQCQEAIRPHHMDPVPLDALHLTLVHVAFTDEVSKQEIDDVAALGGNLLKGLAPFNLSAIPLAGSRGAIRFTVTPWDSLLQIHQRLHKSVTTVLSRQSPKPTESFRPHISIAYNNRLRDITPIVNTVSGLRELSPVTIDVSKVHLVELRRDNRAYRWATRHVFPLITP